MPYRYENRTIYTHSDPMYKDLLKDRRLKRISHYNTPTFKDLSEDEIASLNIVSHIWKVGDRFYKLAEEYYDDVTLWWVIAWFNHTPTESHMRLGEVLYIPLPLYAVLNYYDY